MRFNFLITIISVYFAGITTMISQDYMPASYLGSKQDLNDFISNEMVYPEIALDKKIQGTVKLSFIVTKEGYAKDIVLKRSVDSLLDQEATRLLKMMFWVPATHYGVAVAGRHEISIPFKVRKYNRYCKSRGYENPYEDVEKIDSSLKVYAYKNVYPQPEPLFEDENKRLGEFIVENIQYPKLALQQSIKGTVTIQFIVEASGKASHFKIINSVGGGCNEEAKRIIKLINWTPGQHKGKTIRTRMSLDITFNLNECSDINYFHNNQNRSF